MRKKILRTAVAAVLIFSMMTATAFAEAAVVTGSDVNIRSGPGVNYRVLECLPRGASVTVTDRSNSDWYAVEYDGISGFMSSRYLSVTEDDSSAVVVSGEGSGYINAMYVRFRSGPSTSSSILGEYNKGKEVSITGTSGDWTACVIDGRAGYVSSQYVTAYDSGSDNGSYEGEFNGGALVVIPGGEAPSVSPSPVPTDNGSSGVIVVDPGDTEPTSTPAPTPTPSSGGNVIVVDPGDTEPTPTPAPTPTPSSGGSVIVVDPGDTEPTPTPTPAPTPTPSVTVDPVEEKAGYIDGDYVRFRTGPSTSHSIIASYNRGKELTITGVSGDWTACTIDGQAGFVYSQYVKESSPNTSTNPGGSTTSEAGYITGNNVRFRSGASMSSSILGELFYGNSVTITGTSGDWTAITYNGQAGYVYSQYVTKGTYQNTSSGGSELGREIADYALQFVGYNYSWGGASPSTGFDCSGLMYYVYKQFGYTLNRVACDQARNGVHVDPSDLQPGDLLCFYSGSDYIGHVGMYIGNNMFVHAANSNSGVITSPLTGYYATRGYEARRII